MKHRITYAQMAAIPSLSRGVTMTHEIEELIAHSRAAMESAYAPYSTFRVGAAVLADSGRIYSGCNVENASYGLSMCAERVAVFRAVSSGERIVKAVAISNSSDKPAFPCGACRQVFAEFEPKDEPTHIYLISGLGIQTYTLADLLPHAFRI